MAQVEHGAGAQSVLISADADAIAAVAEHLGEGDVTSDRSRLAGTPPSPSSMSTRPSTCSSRSPTRTRVLEPDRARRGDLPRSAFGSGVRRLRRRARTTSCRRAGMPASPRASVRSSTFAPRRSWRFPPRRWPRWSRPWSHSRRPKACPTTPARRRSAPSGSPKPRKDSPSNAAQARGNRCRRRSQAVRRRAVQPGHPGRERRLLRRPGRPRSRVPARWSRVVSTPRPSGCSKTSSAVLAGAGLGLRACGQDHRVRDRPRRLRARSTRSTPSTSPRIRPPARPCRSPRCRPALRLRSRSSPSTSAGVGARAP